jgi:hypothetical protein
MKMKLIFLDIDGVMNHRKHFVRSRLHDGQEFCPIAVRNLREILKRTGAKIVVSSTWRKMGLTKIKELFRNYDMQQYIHGITPVIEDVIRGKEIQQYLIGLSDVESYVILDDDDDMGDLLPRLVHTSQLDGLNDEKREEVIRLLTA